VAIYPSLYVGKEDKKEMKPIGSLWGPFTFGTDKFFNIVRLIPLNISIGNVEKLG